MRSGAARVETATNESQRADPDLAVAGNGSATYQRNRSRGRLLRRIDGANT
jgi:hypothetical protein